MKAHLVFLLNFVIITLQSFLDVNSLRNSTNPIIPNRIMTWYSPNENHVVAISKSNLTQMYGNQFHFMYINYNAQNYTIQNYPLNFSAIIAKSNHQNYNDANISNRTFLVLDSSRTNISIFNNNGWVRNITINNSFVSDMCLQTNRVQFYTLEHTNVSGSPYILGYYNFVSNWTRKINITQMYDPLFHPMIKCIRTSIYINFTDKVKVYSLNQSMFNIKNIKNHGNLSYMHAFGDYMTVQNTSHILMFSSVNNYSLQYMIKKSVAYIYYYTLFYGKSEGYIFMTRKLINGTSVELTQFDIDANRFIVNSFVTNSNSTCMQMVHNNIFLFENAYYVPDAKAFFVDNCYSSATNTCYPNYTYSTTLTNYGSTVRYSGCQKNIPMAGGYSSITYSPANSATQYETVQIYNIYNDNNNFDGCCILNLTNLTNTTNITNIINNTTNITNTTTNNITNINITNNITTTNINNTNTNNTNTANNINNTINITNNTNILIINITNNTNLTNHTNQTNNFIHNKTQFNQTNYINNTNKNQNNHNTSNQNMNYMQKYKTEGMRIMQKFISIVVIMAQTNRVFPQGFQGLAMIIDDLSLYIYHPTTYPYSFQYFIQESVFIKQISINQQFKNYINVFSNDALLYDKVSIINEKSMSNIGNIYFIVSAQGSYLIETLIVFIIFVILKIISFFIYKLSFRFKMMNLLYKRMKKSSRWWTLITGICQSNMTQLSFFCFIQLLLFSNFNFVNKLNLFFVVLIIFLLIMYCIVFYPITFAFDKKKYSKYLLTRTKHHQSGYLLQMTIFVTKSFVRGLITGLFINNYNLMMILLAVTNLFFLIYSLCLHTSFLNRILKGIIIGYLLCLFFLDFYFVLKNMHFDIHKNFNKQLACLITLLIMLGLVIVQIILQLMKISFHFFNRCTKQQNQKLVHISQLVKIQNTQNVQQPNHIPKKSTIEKILNANTQSIKKQAILFKQHKINSQKQHYLLYYNSNKTKKINHQKENKADNQKLQGSNQANIFAAKTKKIIIKF